MSQQFVLVPPILAGVPWAQDCGDTVVSETLEPGVAVTLEVKAERNGVSLSLSVSKGFTSHPSLHPDRLSTSACAQRSVW